MLSNGYVGYTSPGTETGINSGAFGFQCDGYPKMIPDENAVYSRFSKFSIFLVNIENRIQNCNGRPQFLLTTEGYEGEWQQGGAYPAV